MKITDVGVVNRTSIDSSTALVRVETDDGISGIGSTAAPVPQITAVVEIGAASLKPLLIGEDPTEAGRLWRKMYEVSQAQRGRGGDGGVAVNAMAAVDMALWDIAGKASGVPVYKLLGGAVKTRVMVYASTSRSDRRTASRGPGQGRRMKTAEEMAMESREYVEQGFKAIKFGWGNHFDSEGQDSLAAVRDTIGPDIRLMLDFGVPDYLAEGWSARDALKVSRLLEKYDIYFLEEALEPHDVDGFAALTRESPVRIATGESLTTVREFQQLIERRAVDIVQPDAQQMGITQFWRVAQMAEDAGILCIPHCPWTGMAAAAHLNVLATTGNGAMIEYPGFASFERGSATQVRTDAMHNRVIETPLELVNGFLELPQRPGLGLGNYVADAVAELESLERKG